MSFIEENCIVFDTEDENKLEYTQIHKVFTQLALTMSIGFLEDCRGLAGRVDGRTRNHSGIVFRSM
jgi:hypothetical protein